MENKNEKPLIIPENCPPMDYVINGFTRVDMSYVALSILIGAVLGISLWTKYDNPLIGIIVCFLIIGITTSIFRRNANAENVIDLIRIFREYKKSPKQYEYEYVNIWEQSGRNKRNEDRKK